MKFLGKYRAEVVNIRDPEKRGRIKVMCPKVLGNNISNWAFPCFPPNYFSLPKIGDLVFVEFEDGDRDEPIWTGIFYTTSQFTSRFGGVYDSTTDFTKTHLIDIKSDKVTSKEIETEKLESKEATIQDLKTSKKK